MPYRPVIRIEDSAVQAALDSLNKRDLKTLRERVLEDVSMEALHVMTPNVPVAVKRWRKGYRRGLLRKSTVKIVRSNRIFIGTTRRYGMFVKRGVRWPTAQYPHGAPSQAGPRPYDRWTLEELSAKAPAMVKNRAEEIIAGRWRLWA